MALALTNTRCAEDMMVPVLVRNSRTNRLRSEATRLQNRIRTLRSAASLPITAELLAKAEGQVASTLRRLALYSSRVQ